MSIQICCACGTSYPAAQAPPPCCPICNDERQFVPAGGQRWTAARYVELLKDGA